MGLDKERSKKYTLQTESGLLLSVLFMFKLNASGSSLFLHWASSPLCTLLLMIQIDPFVISALALFFFSELNGHKLLNRVLGKQVGR